MTAVDKNYQNYGIGAKLKWAQRERALQEGVNYIKWTFQPVQARNAFFNLERLGATIMFTRRTFTVRIIRLPLNKTACAALTATVFSPIGSSTRRKSSRFPKKKSMKKTMKSRNNRNSQRLERIGRRGYGESNRRTGKNQTRISKSIRRRVDC
jgi:hypothetical protein